MPLAGEFECLGLCLHGKCGVVCEIVFAITDIPCCPDRPLVTAWHSYSQQAPHNLTWFSWKERQYKTEDIVDQLVFHYTVEGNVLLTLPGHALTLPVRESLLVEPRRLHE